METPKKASCNKESAEQSPPEDAQEELVASSDVTASAGCQADGNTNSDPGVDSASPSPGNDSNYTPTRRNASVEAIESESDPKHPALDSGSYSDSQRNISLDNMAENSRQEEVNPGLDTAIGENDSPDEDLRENNLPDQDISENDSQEEDNRENDLLDEDRDNSECLRYENGILTYRDKESFENVIIAEDYSNTDNGADFGVINKIESDTSDSTDKGTALDNSAEDTDNCVDTRGQRVPAIEKQLRGRRCDIQQEKRKQPGLRQRKGDQRSPSNVKGNSPYSQVLVRLNHQFDARVKPGSDGRVKHGRHRVSSTVGYRHSGTSSTAVHHKSSSPSTVRKHRSRKAADKICPSSPSKSCVGPSKASTVRPSDRPSDHPLPPSKTSDATSAKGLDASSSPSKVSVSSSAKWSTAASLSSQIRSSTHRIGCLTCRFRQVWQWRGNE